MGERRRRIDKVLDATFLTKLSEWPLDELRSRHAECLEIETEVSYVRRMTQARSDILEAEIDRRASGGAIGDLIAALPEILADEGPRAPVAKSRLTRRLAPSMDIMGEARPRAPHHRRHLGEAAEPRRRRAAVHAPRARAAGATGVAAATRAAPGHRPHGGRLDRPAQGAPGVISARE
jgi:RsiG-like